MHKDSTAIRAGEALGEKVWKTQDQLILDWRMPPDIARLMLFERLQYVIEQSVEDMSEKQMSLNLIERIKKLYPKKFALIRTQIDVVRQKELSSI